ncbi:MAG: hypothetical protein B7Z20_11005 [Sphingobium sp. 32-64-5]|nr:MAG: hypothetical protein B7Z20_11005 [Sphingobium sp. 32-64-5]
MLGAGVLGLIFGSFLAALAMRWPEGRSVLAGRSCCDGCGRTLRAVELVPVLSALVSRGRCRECGARIDPLHMGMELGCAFIAMESAVTFSLPAPAHNRRPVWSDRRRKAPRCRCPSRPSPRFARYSAHHARRAATAAPCRSGSPAGTARRFRRRSPRRSTPATGRGPHIGCSAAPAAAPAPARRSPPQIPPSHHPIPARRWAARQSCAPPPCCRSHRQGPDG